MAKSFEKGAKDAGNDVKIISLRDLNLNFCKGCMLCQKTKKCIINDDVNTILDDIQNASILVFATPIYYYSVSG